MKQYLRGEAFIMDLKNLLIAVFGLTMSVAFVGCDTDEDCDDAGVCTGDGGEGGAGGAGGAGGEGGGGAAAYDRIIVVDTSAEENMAGTPGSDICGISVECEGTSINASAESNEPGDGDICGDGDEGCSADRGDSAAVEDDGSACDPASSPDSDYMSLGIGGWVSTSFGQDINGCTVSVVEHSGNDAESFTVYACMGDSDDPANADTCTEVASSSGGNATGAVPAE